MFYGVAVLSPPRRRHMHLVSSETKTISVPEERTLRRHSSSSLLCCFCAVGQNAPPGVAHPKRSQTSTADNGAKEEGGVQLRKPGTPGSRGAPPSSPLLGNANNPNKADIPDRRKGVATGPSVSDRTSGLQRCSAVLRPSGSRGFIVFTTDGAQASTLMWVCCSAE